jgi:hypothetical protein
VLLSFTDRLCDADELSSWDGGDRTLLMCNVADASGGVVAATNVAIEGPGVMPDALVFTGQSVQNAQIQAIWDPVSLQLSLAPHLVTEVACIDNQTCDFWYQVVIRESSSQTVLDFVTGTQTRDGVIDSVDIDLTPYKATPLHITFFVDMMTMAQGDTAVFGDPRIREG